MRQRLISIALFVATFVFGFFYIDRTAQAQGVAAAISLWVGSDFVSATNPLPVAVK
jgi:hypothetical protein